MRNLAYRDLRFPRLGARRSGGLNPSAALLAALSDGAAQVIMHPLEYGSMFQDRAGTTPVTASGQLVGLALDWGQSGGMPQPGPERIPNGTFDTDTSGWTIGGSNAGKATISAVSGQLVVESSSYDTNGLWGQTSFPTEIGKTYRLSFDFIGIANGSARYARVGGPSITVSSGVLESLTNAPIGTNSLIFTAINTTTWVALGHLHGTSPSKTTWDNISVKELAGSPVIAISDASRGVFRDVGGKRWIEYNGVNTAYQTPALPAPGVDKAQVFAGVRKLSDAAVGTVAELSASADDNNGSIFIRAPQGAATGTYIFRSRGAIASNAISPNSFAAPTTNVLTGIGDISGDSAILRVDGAQVAQSTADQGSGNYNPSGTYPIYYGARAGTSLFLYGNHYRTLGPIVRFGTNATPEQIAAAEAYYTAGLPS